MISLPRPLPELALQLGDQRPQRIHLRLQVPDAIVGGAAIHDAPDLDGEVVHGSSPNAFVPSGKAAFYSFWGRLRPTRSHVSARRFGIRSRIHFRTARVRV